nr:flagellar biosynthesis protein FlhB [Deltaproteobacteria bacterium]
MAAGFDHDKTEPATPKRREEARKKGQVARSREVPSVFILFSGLGALSFGGSWMIWHCSDLMRKTFQDLISIEVSEAAAPVLIQEIMVRTAILLLPLLLAVLVAGVAANLLQVGLFFTSEPLAPQLSRLDPLKGVSRLLSSQSLAELVKSILKIVLIGWIAYDLVKAEMEAMPSLMTCSVAEILSFIGFSSLRITLYTCLALAVVALLDYGFQRWNYEKELRMSKQEIKEEMKQREGDPLIKARIRRVQMELSRRRMMEAVPHADVVITNPTTLAVALKYDPNEMSAPQVVAKGAGFIAERIRAIAKESGVPIVEQKPLAQALYKMVEIGGAVPISLYQAVAEVLAYVYRLKGMRGPR